jgi:glycosyltransferase involved in cell wall biosynthesis
MQQVAYDLDESLPRQGIESTVLDLELETATSANGRMGRLGALTSAWLRLIRRWNAERPDAVIAHTMKNAVYSLTAARLARIRGRVAVVHLDRRTLGRQRVVLMVALAYAGVVTDVVFVGEAVADSFSGLPRRIKRLCRTIQNGVQLPAAPPKGGATFGDRGTTHLISAARLVPVKNIQTIVRAVALASTPVTLDICGDGPLRGELEHLAICLGASVRFHGQVDHEALGRLYASSDMFLFPTKGEGLPLVLIEAAVAGLPAIVSDYPFNREVMGDAALYCNADSVQEWTYAIERLGGDAQLRSSMTSAGLSRADHFSVDRMSAEYARLLRNRLGKTA